MQTKPKPCNGIGKAQGFKGCGTKTIYRKYGLCDSCRRDFLLNDERGKIIIAKATLKAKAPREKAERELEQARQEKKKKSSLETLKMNVRNVCHSAIKKRDKYKPCISCDEPWHSSFQAGHYYKAELFSSLKYDEDNIHGQCVGCNNRKEGNLSQYAVNLPNRIGKEKFEVLQEKAALEKQNDFKWERSKLNEIRKYYQQKLKEL